MKNIVRIVILSTLIIPSIYASEQIITRAQKRALSPSEAPDAKKFKPAPLTPTLSSSSSGDTVPSLAVPALNEAICLSLLNAIDTQQKELGAMDKRVIAVESRSQKVTDTSRELCKKVGKLTERVNKHTSDIYETKREFNKQLKRCITRELGDQLQEPAEQSEEMEKMRKEFSQYKNEQEAHVAMLIQKIDFFAQLSIQTSQNLAALSNLVANLYKVDPMVTTELNEQIHFTPFL